MNMICHAFMICRWVRSPHTCSFSDEIYICCWGQLGLGKGGGGGGVGGEVGGVLIASLRTFIHMMISFC